MINFVEYILETSYQKGILICKFYKKCNCNTYICNVQLFLKKTPRGITPSIISMHFVRTKLRMSATNQRLLLQKFTSFFFTIDIRLLSTYVSFMFLYFLRFGLFKFLPKPFLHVYKNEVKLNSTLYIVVEFFN